MVTSRSSRPGKVLTCLGSLWFFLAFIWVSPLMIFVGLFESVWRIPYEAYRIMGRVEFPMAAATAAIGVLLWRRAARKLTLADYLIVSGGAVAAVIAVSVFNGWIRL